MSAPAAALDIGLLLPFSLEAAGIRPVHKAKMTRHVLACNGEEQRCIPHADLQTCQALSSDPVYLASKR